jgi:hypothetical protein
MPPHGVLNGGGPVFTHEGQPVTSSRLRTDDPWPFWHWDLERVTRWPPGAPAGKPSRESTSVLRSTASQPRRHDLLTLRCHDPNQPAVRQVSQCQWRIVQAQLTRLGIDHPALPLPITYDTWDIHSAVCHSWTPTGQRTVVGS